MMKPKPLADRVVLSMQSKAEEKDPERNLSAASAQEKPEIYEVVGRIPGGIVDGNEAKHGSQKSAKSASLSASTAAADKASDEQEYTIVRQSDILAIVE